MHADMPARLEYWDFQHSSAAAFPQRQSGAGSQSGRCTSASERFRASDDSTDPGGGCGSNVTGATQAPLCTFRRGEPRGSLSHTACHEAPWRLLCRMPRQPKRAQRTRWWAPPPLRPPGMRTPRGTLMPASWRSCWRDLPATARASPPPRTTAAATAAAAAATVQWMQIQLGSSCGKLRRRQSSGGMRSLPILPVRASTEHLTYAAACGHILRICWHLCVRI